MTPSNPEVLPTYGASPSTSYGPAATSAPAAAVERIRSRDGYWMLRTSVPVAPFRLTVLSLPAQDPERFLFSLSQIPAAHAECPLGIMVDGEIVSPNVEDRRVAVGGRVIEALVPTTVLRRMAAAERVSGRVCDEQWTLDATGKDHLREFVRRLDEELAWARQSSAGGERPTPTAPSGGQQAAPSEPTPTE